MRLGTTILLGTALIVGGCATGERVNRPRPTAVRSERDLYAASTRASRPALREWEEASRRALRSGNRITPSFRDRLVFPAGRPNAAAYRVSLVRGQSLSVSVTSISGADDVFTDMFHHVGGDIFRPVHWARRSSDGGTFTARVDGEYVLRVQPRIGVGGVYDVELLGNAALLFPVSDADGTAIGGVFGDPREDGARTHEGIDIFAPRGTAVIAVADGRITQARNTPVGGLVIWHEDAVSALTYYYAHLDEVLVHEGAYVRAGDVIGRVGDTGNARGTRPHLHFAIYRPGRIPLDPAHLLPYR